MLAVKFIDIYYICYFFSAPFFLPILPPHQARENRTAQTLLILGYAP